MRAGRRLRRGLGDSRSRDPGACGGRADRLRTPSACL